MAGEGYTHVIAGGGTAGCVLAARLTADAGARVLLLEAGGRDRSPLIHMPVGFAKMTSGPFTWGLKTVPQAHADNREIPYAQARVLGGGSSINAEVFTRGHPSDYDRWARDEGCPGWAFADIRRHFMRAEGNAILAGPWHGTEGPLGVSNIPDPQPVSRAFVQACQEAGLPYNADFNGPVQEGAGIYQTTTRNARRSSASVAYLRPALGRPNLRVVTGALVRRIVIERGRAVAVEYTAGGRSETARAAAEVIVTAGAIGSPKLLMLSGIGPADHLGATGVPVAHDLPGVGANLTDHFGIDIVAELRGPHSLDRYRRWPDMLAAGLQYVLFRSGPVTSNLVEGGAFWHSAGSGAGAGAVPDLQFHFLAGAGAEEGVPGVPSGSGITLNSYTLRPKSRGSVRLRSADPAALPLVDPNFLAEPEDLAVSTEGVRMSLEIFAQKSLGKYILRMHQPAERPATPSALAAYARRHGRTSYHPTGTCRMGSGPDAVVGPDLRVRGLDGLRVCDSSVMPSLVGSNTNAPTIMIAEKASDLIRGNR